MVLAIEQKYEDKMKLMNEALSRGDCVSYSKLVDLNGAKDYDDFAYNRGLAERDYTKNASLKRKKKILRVDRDSRLIKAVEYPKMIDFFDPENHIEDKVNILKNVLNYKGLRVASGREGFLSIDECKPERINSVLRDHYNIAKNRQR
ncbi:MAG: hypothetical protein AABW50_01170 [Nanoarchaeota archaeon]